MDVIKIQIDTNAQNAGKTFDDLSNKLKNTDNAANDLRKQIKGLKDELYKLTPGTEEYAQVLEQLGTKMDQLQETTQQVRAATGGLDTVFQTTTNATASMASGFSAATGVIALFGGDAEDLQKTFVKLQAVMSIMNGLKGFAGFIKTTKAASISLRTFLNTSKSTTQALNTQNAATQSLNTTEVTATATTFSLRSAIQSVTAAIAANPIGAILVAITAAITAVTSALRHLSSAAEEAREMQELQASLLAKVEGKYTDVYDAIEADNDAMQRRITRLKALGAEEKEITEIIKTETEKWKDILERRKAVLENNIRLTEATKANEEALKTWGEELDKVNATLKQYDETLNNISDNTLPDWWQANNDAFTELDRSLTRMVNQGFMTTAGKYRREISELQEDVNKAQKELSNLQNYRLNPGNSAEQNYYWDEQIEQQERYISTTQRQIKELRTKVEDEVDKSIKKNSENFKKLEKEFADKFPEMQNKVKTFESEMQHMFDDFGLSEEEITGRVRNTYAYIISDIDKFIETWRKKAEELKNTGQISVTAYDTFVKELEEKSKELKDNVNGVTGEIELTDYATAINNRILRDVARLKEGLTTINDLYKQGLINEEQYQKAYIDHVQAFNDNLADESEEVEWYLNAIMNGEFEEQNHTENGVESLTEFLERNKMTIQQYVDMLRSLFEQSGQVLPPDFAKSITDDTSKIIDAQLKEIETRTKNGLRDLANTVALDSTAWIHGKGDGGIISALIFGGGKSPTQAYEEAQKYAQDVCKALYDEYTAEIELIKTKMSLLDQNSDAYRKYAEQIEEIQRKLTEAQIDYEQKQVDNAADYADKIKDIGMSTFDALGGLASAMGSYYGEQKEQAKELYGENSEEYQKYLKKEGTMKIAEVWANWATGVMAAWAANAKYGVASYILAALQTAALTATAIASTQQINRSTKANSSGGGSTANVSGLTDRVIMGQVQDTDQTAQLNAGYNQGAQRVFVTVDDINNGQDANRTAVTSNQF